MSYESRNFAIEDLLSERATFENKLAVAQHKSIYAESVAESFYWDKEQKTICETISFINKLLHDYVR